MEEKSKIWYLENFNFFDELTMEQRTFVCQNTMMKTISEEESVYFQEDLAHSVYFLKEGKIRISRINQEGQEFVVAMLGPGEIFGEGSIINGRRRKETAIAEERTTFCVMREENMKKLLLMAPALNLKFSQMLEKKLEKAQKRLEDLSFKNNYQRIIGFLKETALISSPGPNGEVVIQNKFTHEKIAQLTSTNRQEVSSVFSLLKKNGVIDYDRKTIRVFNLNQLETP